MASIFVISCGVCHQPSTGVTLKLEGGIQSCGSSPRISIEFGFKPISSFASRYAVWESELSPSSTRPPGNAGCPGWAFKCDARSMITTSPKFSRGPNRTSTAASRVDSSGTACLERSLGCNVGSRVINWFIHSGALISVTSLH